MKQDYTQEKNYILAKKRVDKLKGFYWHLTSYVIINIFISCTIIFGLMHEDKESFFDAIANFGVYATWFFWGIGLAFHWMNVFGQNIFFGKKWEEKKIQESIWIIQIFNNGTRF